MRLWNICAISALFIVVGTACTAIQCRIKDRAVDTLAKGTAEFLECDGLDAIKADFNKAAEAVGICKKTQTGPIADSLCKPVIDQALGAVVDNVPPKAWACKATKAKEKLSAFLVEKCKLLPVEG